MESSPCEQRTKEKDIQSYSLHLYIYFHFVCVCVCVSQNFIKVEENREIF